MREMILNSDKLKTAELNAATVNNIKKQGGRGGSKSVNVKSG